MYIEKFKYGRSDNDLNYIITFDSGYVYAPYIPVITQQMINVYISKPINPLYYKTIKIFGR